MKNIESEEFNNAANFLGKSQTSVDAFIANQEGDDKKKKKGDKDVESQDDTQ